MSLIKILYCGDLKTHCLHENGTEINTAAPINHQSSDGYSPTDLLAISLGSCILTLLGIAAARLHLDLKAAQATVEKTMSLRAPRRIELFKVQVHVPIEVSHQQRQQLELAALTCPVKETLHPDVQLEIEFFWKDHSEGQPAIQQ